MTNHQEAFKSHVHLYKLQYKSTGLMNRSFPSCIKPLFHSGAKCKAIGMNMIFYSHVNTIHFRKQSFKLGLVLKVEVFRTRKQPTIEQKSLVLKQPPAQLVYWQTQKTVSIRKISGTFIVYWPIKTKFRMRKQTSKPQTNYRCCLRFGYLAL